MILRPIYSDIISKINQSVQRDEILSTDIIRAINDAISVIRIDYVGRGLGQSFAITEQYYFSMRDMNYPFLHATELESTPMKTAPITNSIQNLMGFVTDDELQDASATYALGATTVKQDDTNGVFRAYQCVKGFTSTNTFDLTFTKEQIRQYRSNNGLKYSTGDVIYDGTSYWKLTADLTNNQAYTFVASGAGAGQINATQVYWLDIGEAAINPVYIEFDRIQELRLMSRNNFFGYTIKDNILYGTPNIQRFTISYVPEWTYVDDLDADVRITADMIPKIKQAALASLAIKLPGQTNE